MRVGSDGEGQFRSLFRRQVDIGRDGIIGAAIGLERFAPARRSICRTDAAEIGQRRRHGREGVGLVAHDGSDEARSEEHTSELKSLMRISYAVFCLKKNKIEKNTRIATP